MPGYPVFVALHIGCGIVALITFWMAAWMRKGSPRHRAVGKVFMAAMAGIVLTGVPMVLEFVLVRRQPGIGLFLAYLMAITAQACWSAWRAVTDKRDWRRMVGRIGWTLNTWIPVALALGVLVVGVRKGDALFMGFAGIGLLAGWQMWRFARRGPDRPDWALRQHYQSILGAGVATHVAFLSIGMRPVWAWLQTHTEVPAALIQLFPWFAPLAVATLAGVWLGRKYGRKPRASAPGAPMREASPPPIEPR